MGDDGRAKGKEREGKGERIWGEKRVLQHEKIKKLTSKFPSFK